MNKYIIKDEADRRQMCAILAVNGYTVAVQTVKVEKTNRKAVVVFDEEDCSQLQKNKF